MGKNGAICWRKTSYVFALLLTFPIETFNFKTSHYLPCSHILNSLSSARACLTMPDDGAANHPMSEAERRALLDSIPEFSTFEAHKENIAQKPQGRRAADLANLFSQSDRDRLAHLEAKRTEFENAIASLEDLDDPLEPYLAYMEVIEACHTQGPSGELVNVLQLATQQFQDDDIYRNDIRYLTCWTKFARLAEDWQAVYKFLSDSDIGQCHARYYEEYAHLLEENRK